MKCVLAFVGLVVVMGGVAVAAESTTTSGPAGVVVDLSSPRATLLSLYGAMRAGDLNGVKACLIFETRQEGEMFELNFALVAAPLKLKQAFETRFGAEAGKMFESDAGEKGIEASLEKAKVVEIQVDGETATVDEKKANANPNAEGELTGVTLKLADGKWRVVAGTLSDSGGEVSPQQMELIRNMSHAVSNGCEHTLARLAKGEFATPEQAYAAYHAEVQSGSAKKP